MNRLLLLTFFVGAIVSNGLSQSDTQWKLFSTNPTDLQENNSSETIIDDSLSSIIQLDFSQPVGNVVIHKDERIDLISELLSTPKGKNPLTIDGFRVQIFFDQNMRDVNRAKDDFIKSYPRVNTYIDFDAPPNHRLRVGNFRSKLDAQRFQNEIKKDYPNATIVKNIQIELPSITTLN